MSLAEPNRVGRYVCLYNACDSHVIHDQHWKKLVGCGLAFFTGRVNEQNTEQYTPDHDLDLCHWRFSYEWIGYRSMA
jgi:hypothetical protein